MDLLGAVDDVLDVPIDDASLDAQVAARQAVLARELAAVEAAEADVERRRHAVAVAQDSIARTEAALAERARELDGHDAAQAAVRRDLAARVAEAESYRQDLQSVLDAVGALAVQAGTLMALVERRVGGVEHVTASVWPAAPTPPVWPATAPPVWPAGAAAPRV